MEDTTYPVVQFLELYGHVFIAGAVVFWVCLIIACVLLVRWIVKH
jgi:hypothetical protein